MPQYSNEGVESCDYLGTEEIRNHGFIDIYHCKDSVPFESMVAKSNDDPRMNTKIPIHHLLNDTPSGYPPITKLLKKYYQDLISSS